MGLPILPLWVTRSSLFLNFACRQTRQPRWTPTKHRCHSSTPAHPKTPFRPSSLPPLPTHPSARFLWPLSLTPTAARRPLTMILEFSLRSDSAMLCSLLRRAATLFFWVEVDLPGYGEAFIELREREIEKKKCSTETQANFYNATEETRSAEARSRYVQATTTCVKKPTMFVSTTAAVRFGLHNSLYSRCISVSNYCASDCSLCHSRLLERPPRFFFFFLFSPAFNLRRGCSSAAIRQSLFTATQVPADELAAVNFRLLLFPGSSQILTGTNIWIVKSETRNKWKQF